MGCLPHRPILQNHADELGGRDMTSEHSRLVALRELSDRSAAVETETSRGWHLAVDRLRVIAVLKVRA